MTKPQSASLYNLRNKQLKKNSAGEHNTAYAYLTFLLYVTRTSQPRTTAWILVAASSRLRSAARSSLASLVASKNAPRFDSLVPNILGN